MTSIGSNRMKRSSDLERWYRGYLGLNSVSDDTARRLRDLTTEVPMFDVYPNAIELEYKGRDSNRIVVKTLMRLASLVDNADGEVRCQVTGDADQLWFEFYRIRGGRLFPTIRRDYAEART